KKPRNITRGSDWSGGRPLQLQQQYRLIPHPARAAQDGLDGGVDGLHYAEADAVVTIGRDSLDVAEEEVPRRSISGSRCQRKASIQPRRKSRTPGRVLYLHNRSSCSRKT